VDSQNEPKLDIQTQVDTLKKSVIDLASVLEDVIGILQFGNPVIGLRRTLEKATKRVKSLEKAKTVKL
jgi:hypothetical protein